MPGEIDIKMPPMADAYVGLLKEHGVDVDIGRILTAARRAPLRGIRALASVLVDNADPWIISMIYLIVKPAFTEELGEDEEEAQMNAALFLVEAYALARRLVEDDVFFDDDEEDPIAESSEAVLSAFEADIGDPEVRMGCIGVVACLLAAKAARRLGLQFSDEGGSS